MVARFKSPPLVKGNIDVFVSTEMRSRALDVSSSALRERTKPREKATRDEETWTPAKDGGSGEKARTVDVM